MRLRESQKGMTMIGWVLVGIVAGIVVMAAIRLFPVYMESYTVSSVMESVATDRDVGSSPESVRRALSRRMQVDNISAVSLDDFKVEQVDGRPMLVVAYEHRVDFVANIDFVVSFDKQQAIRGQ